MYLSLGWCSHNYASVFHSYILSIALLANLIDILFKKVISVAEHILNNTKANFSVVLSALASLSGLAGLKLGGTPIGGGAVLLIDPIQ